VLGAVIGALIMGVMNNGMSILGIGIDYQQVIKGWCCSAPSSSTSTTMASVRRHPETAGRRRQRRRSRAMRAEAIEIAAGGAAA
jgi:hypothetical protein